MSMMLRRFLVGALCVLAGSGCASLQQGTGKHVLWQVQDADNTVYLLGSVHVLPRRAHPFPRAIEDAFDKSRDIVFEVDLSRYDEGEILTAMQKEGEYPKGDSLAKHLTPTARKLLTEVLPLFGLDFESVQTLRPRFLADAIMAKYLHDRGIRSEFGVDEHFLKQARDERRPISGLESLELQASMHSRISDAEGERYLVETILSLPEIERTVLHIGNAWRKGRTAELDALLNAQAEQDPEENERLFTKRNAAWLPKIIARIDGKTDTMVIVGAGHLVGRAGIVATLRKRGYTVTQL